MLKTDKFGDIGNHTLLLTLSDGQPLFTAKNFSIEIFNTPPYFISDPPKNLTLKFNNTFELYLPLALDNESNPIYPSLKSLNNQ